MKAVIKSLDATSSGMPMCNATDEKGINHWLFNGYHYQVGTKVEIQFIQKGVAHFEWKIKERSNG